MDYRDCSFCGGKVIEERIDTEFWCDEKLVIYKSVPAGVCQNCGEQYFTLKVYGEMLKKANSPEAILETIEVPVTEFESEFLPV
jgi:YgiT-type zinc finger domain-containing protein